MSERATTVPADDGFAIAVPIFDGNGACGFVLVPVVAWRVEGRADSGRLIPLPEDEDDVDLDDLYAIQHPDGSFRFPARRVVRPPAKTFDQRQRGRAG